MEDKTYKTCSDSVQGRPIALAPVRESATPLAACLAAQRPASSVHSKPRTTAHRSRADAAHDKLPFHLLTAAVQKVERQLRQQTERRPPRPPPPAACRLQSADPSRLPSDGRTHGRGVVSRNWAGTAWELPTFQLRTSTPAGKRVTALDPAEASCAPACPYSRCGALALLHAGVGAPCIVRRWLVLYWVAEPTSNRRPSGMGRAEAWRCGGVEVRLAEVLRAAQQREGASE